MTQKIEKSSNGNQNTKNVESNNVYRLIEKTTEQLTASASRYNERAESGQVITFEKAEQKKAVGNAANADKDGYLQGIFWTGYLTTADGQRHNFERLDSNGISRHFSNLCTWKRATRTTLLDGNATRTDEQRKEDAQKAIEDARTKPAPNSVTALLWSFAEQSTIILDEETKKPHALLDILTAAVVETMKKADNEAAEKAQSKETKAAKAQRELQEAKAAAEAATNATDAAIKLLLATGQYKSEEEVRKALGL